MIASASLDLLCINGVFLINCVIDLDLHSFCFCFRSKIELGDVTPHNIKQLKRLNTVVFPVSYNERFYKDVLEVGELAKLGNIHNEGFFPF